MASLRFNGNRHKVFSILENQKFLDAINNAWNAPSVEDKDVRDAMLEELRGVSEGVRIGQGRRKKESRCSMAERVVELGVDHSRQPQGSAQRSALVC